MARRIEQALFWLLLATAVALFGFFIAVLAGMIPVDEPFSDSTEPVAAAPMTRPSTDVTTEQLPVAARPKPKVVAKVVATVVVTASRGDCWISARLGSETGPLLEERLLRQGESVTLTGARIWLSAGAAANLDLTVNGAARELEPGTIAVLLSPT